MTSVPSEIHEYKGHIFSTTHSYIFAEDEVEFNNLSLVDKFAIPDKFFPNGNIENDVFQHEHCVMNQDEVVDCDHSSDNCDLSVADIDETKIVALKEILMSDDNSSLSCHSPNSTNSTNFDFNKCDNCDLSMADRNETKIVALTEILVADNNSTLSCHSSNSTNLDLEWEYEFPIQIFPSKSSSIPSHNQTVYIDDQKFYLNLQAISPYQQVISHGGYYGDGLNVIIIFSACFLPDKNIPNYDELMKNLFLYFVFTLDQLTADRYSIIFLNGGCHSKNLPVFHWLKKCYQLVNRRLHKSLENLLIVHPSWYMWLLVKCFQPFISSKFKGKLQLVPTLYKLADILPVNSITFPDAVIEYDIWLHVKEKIILDGSA